MEFPGSASPIRDLMGKLLSTMITRLGFSIEPDCALPPDVQALQSSCGTNYGAFHFRRGLSTSKLDFILGGWIYQTLPSGAAINTWSLSTHLNTSTEAPHFLLVIVQRSPESFVLILDLVPRLDLTMFPDYLKDVYEDTKLDRYRKCLETLPEAKVTPFLPPSLYTRSILSPTAALVIVKTSKIETVIRDHVKPVTKKLLRYWIMSYACSDTLREVSSKSYIDMRDEQIKSTFFKILGSNFQDLFGEEQGDKVVDTLKSFFNI